MTIEIIKEKIIDLCEKVSFQLPEDVLRKLEILKKEKSPLVKDLFRLFQENCKIAKKKKIPLCQDTGTSVVFVEKGDKIKIKDIDLIRVINEGIKEGYQKYYLRKSIVKDPLRRQNTGTNTPAVIHITPKKGKKLKITLLQKGGGAENCSQIKMLKPADGYEGCLDFIVNTVKEASSKGCPPYTIGVGIGGNFETCALLAKKALIKPLDKPHKDSFYNKMQEEALKRINKLKIGPQGFGGGVTAIAVNIEVAPCHIASLPIAVNTECIMHRHASVTL